MLKFTAAAAGAIAFFAVAQGQAQAQVMRQPAAPLANAMTEKQARAACRVELSGGRREGRRAMAQKTRICMQNKMNGNNR